ncbi:MAG: epsF 2 [Planctomycetaceae bacterium]|nr:epsF 2 [Planctomycetaceae bacterium]
MPPARVLLVIPTLDRSGAEKQLTLLATGLPRDQFDVRVVALTRGGPYAEDLERHGVPLTILGKRWKFDPLCLWKLSRLIKTWNPDVIHTWLFAANSYGRMVAGGGHRPPVIVSERCVDTWKSGWQLGLDRYQIPRTARLVGNSQSVADFYRGQQFPADRIRVVPNGIELPEAANALSPVERDRRRADLCGLPAGAKVLGFVGRLARQKRVLDLIWMLVLLENVRDDIYLLLVGDGPEREWLERFARDLDIESKVIFLGHRQDIPAILPLLDAFCLASDFEGMSNSVMEAMAVGLPVLASDIPANRELVVEGETGYLIPIGDRAAYARAALSLFERPDMAERLGNAGRQRMATEFSVGQMIQGYIGIYQEVIAEAKTR